MVRLLFWWLWLIVAWVLSGCVVVLTLGCWCCVYYCPLLDLCLFVIVCDLCFLDSVLRGLILRLIDSFAGYVFVFGSILVGGLRCFRCYCV